MAHTLVGIVTSDQRDKTITVSITSRETHPLYRKQYTHTRKYTAHDEKNEAKKGDKVEIAACRPLSKTKAYTLVKVLERSHENIELKDEVANVAGGDETSASLSDQLGGQERVVPVTTGDSEAPRESSVTHKEEGK